jgi:dolichyl-phosphate-mannose-protein mannosyltransferase
MTTLLRARTFVLIMALSICGGAGYGRADSSPPAEKNLLANGDFAKGSVDQPDEWRVEAWVNSPEAFAHHWVHPGDGGPNQLEVENLKANDARWEQAVSLPEGLYHLSVELRGENVGADADGVSVSIMTDGMMSPEVRGTSDWRRVGFYFKVGKHGADIDVALRVGGYGSLNTGRGYYRDARLEKIAALPVGAAPFFDWEAIQKQETPKPIGRPWTLALVLVALCGIVVVGWMLFGVEPVPVQGDLQARETGKSKGPRRR